MTYTYVFLEKAQNEYEDAVFWYKIRSETATKNFVSSIKNTLEIIAANPLRWRCMYKNFHELGVKKFPFLLFILSMKLSRQL